MLAPGPRGQRNARCSSQPTSDMMLALRKYGVTSRRNFTVCATVERGYFLQCVYTKINSNTLFSNLVRYIYLHSSSVRCLSQPTFPEWRVVSSTSSISSRVEFSPIVCELLHQVHKWQTQCNTKKNRRSHCACMEFRWSLRICAHCLHTQP